MTDETYPFLRFANLSKASSMLIQLLRDTTKAGKDTLTDEEMTAHCGRDTSVGGAGNANLGTAISTVLREDGIHWARIRNANAIKRCTPDETMTHMAAARKHIGRTAKKAVRQSATVKPDDLPPEKRPTFNAMMVQLGLILLAGGSKALKKLEARKADPATDPAKQLEALK